jgi:preprotein translocase subunit SecE
VGKDQKDVKVSMGKKAMTKAKKGSKTQGDGVKTEIEQGKPVAQEAPAAPKRMRGTLHLAKGGGKSRPEAPKRVQAVSGKGKVSVPKLARKEPAKPKAQYFTEAVKFFQSVWSELKKVHWPSRSELVAYTIVVLVSVLVVALLIWIADSIISQLLSYMM